MGKYVMMADWTAHGVANVSDSPSRLDAARRLAKAQGGKLTDFYMTMGGHDMVAIVEMPNDAAMATFALKLAGSGAIRTHTMKAFSEKEYRQIIGGLDRKK